jgi:hypothetical protein
MADRASKQVPGEGTPSAEAVGEALRSAVERTLAATAGPATGTRERAQNLLDDVVRRGDAARRQVTRRGEEATARLAERLAIAERRIAALEARLHVQDKARPEPEPSLEEPHGD